MTTNDEKTKTELILIRNAALDTLHNAMMLMDVPPEMIDNGRRDRLVRGWISDAIGKLEGE